jgi:head-tail joining protein
VIGGEIGLNELNRRFKVMRPTTVGDDVGGSTVADVQIGGIVRAKVSQPAGVEQLEAMQAGTSFAVIVHLRPNVDVRRGDHLVALDDGDDLRVKSTVLPSEPVYLRADCEQIQSEGGTP